MPIRSRSISGGVGMCNFKGEGSTNIFDEREPIVQISTIDDTGEWNKPMLITHREIRNAGMTKTQYNNPQRTSWHITRNFVPSYFLTPQVAAFLPDPAQPSNAQLSTMLAARLNPNKPTVDLPVSFLELRELPQLLYEVGKASLKAFAKGNLTYQFGVLPIVSDLVKLVEFGKTFEKRYAELKQLRDKGGYTKKVQLYSSTVVDYPGTIIRTNSYPIQFDSRHLFAVQSTERKYWGYGTILPGESFDRTINDDQLKNLTKRALLGSNLSLTTAWELLPWSWFVDWFANIGDFLTAHRGGLDYKLVDAGICRYGVNTNTYILESSTFGFGKGEHVCTAVSVSKQRVAFIGTLPSFKLPILTARQSGILGSLALLRNR